MSVTMFEANFVDQIRQVECEKVTEKSVITKSGRRAISSEDASFFKTKREAVDYLIGRCESKIARAEMVIEREKEKIEKIMKL